MNSGNVSTSVPLCQIVPYALKRALVRRSNTFMIRKVCSGSTGWAHLQRKTQTSTRKDIIYADHLRSMQGGCLHSNKSKEYNANTNTAKQDSKHHCERCMGSVREFHSAVARGKKEHLNRSVLAKCRVRGWGWWWRFYRFIKGDRYGVTFMANWSLPSSARNSRRNVLLCSWRGGILVAWIA